MQSKKNAVAEMSVTRRSFIKGGAGAIVTAGCLHGLNVHTTALAGQLEQESTTKHYVCPPCGMPCDKLIFDKPGNCPQCGLTLIPANGEGGPARVAILLYDSVEIIDMAGPWEVFGAAGLPVHTVAEKLEPLTLVYGQKIIPDYTFENSPKADVLLVPGGGYGRTAKNAAAMNWIKKSASDAKYVMSVCTGAFLLGEAGLLNGQAATCTYGMIEDLSAFPNTKPVYGVRYVESGKIITTAGLSSGIDGAIYLVSKLRGMAAAQTAALGIEYHWNPQSPWSRSGMADRFLPDGLAHGNARLKGAQTTLLSTAGDERRWEIKVGVSDPKTPANIISLLRERIVASPALGGGMMIKPISHIRSGPTFISSEKESELTWKFSDDRGQAWNGLAVVEPVSDTQDKFVVTLRLNAS